MEQKVRPAPRPIRWIAPVLAVALAGVAALVDDAVPARPARLDVSQPDRSAPAAPIAPRSRDGSIGVVQLASGHEVAAGELLVRPRPGQGEVLDARLANELGAVAIDPLPVLDARRVRLPDGLDLEEARRRVAAFPEAEQATFNGVVRAAGYGRGGPVGRFADWNQSSTMLRPSRRWSRPSHPRLVVAVLDSGVADAPGLLGVERVAPHDALEGDAIPQDEHGHGTFIASLLVGDPGLAGDAALMPVRVLDRDLIGTEASLIEGLHHASLNGADVINLSLVFGAEYLPSQLLDAAIHEALSLGVVVVGAAGNDARAAVRYPAAFPGVIAVGASTPDGGARLTRAGYSAHGAALDLLAPGGDLDVDANRDRLPDGVVAESFDPAHPGRFGPWMFAGTSQAAAHVSAAAVHLLRDGVDPARVGHQLRERARSSVLPYGGGFGPDAGAGHLWLPGVHAVASDVAVVGAQTIAVLHETGGATAAGAVVALVDAAGDPVVGARVHVGMRGGTQRERDCVTDVGGMCSVDGGALDDPGLPVVVEVLAAVLTDGRVARPRTVASTDAVSAALAAVDGTGFGPSSLVWLVDSSFASLWFPSMQTTWVVFGSGEGSALAPTVVALSDAQASLLPGGDATGGTGFGPSSSGWLTLTWSFSYSFSLWTYGGGFGASSIDWSGWTWSFWGGSSLTWGMGSVGSPLHDLTGAAFGSVAAASTGTALR